MSERTRILAGDQFERKLLKAGRSEAPARGRLMRTFCIMKLATANSANPTHLAGSNTAVIA